MFQKQKVAIRHRINFLASQVPLTYEALEDRRVLSANVLGQPELGWELIGEDSVFDELGRLTVHTSSFDTDNNQSADYRVTNRYTYSPDGDMSGYQREDDYGADGIVDSRYWSEWTLNPDGQTAVTVESWDHGADGNLDYQSRTSFTYSETGSLTLVLYEIDNDGDGLFDESYEDVPQDPRSFNYDVNDEFDVQGRLIRTTTSQDIDGDGVVDSLDVTSWAYLENGSVDFLLQESDHDADGVIEWRMFSEYEYDTDQVLVAIHDSIDENGDGQFESTTTHSMIAGSGLPGEFYTMQLGSDFENSPSPEKSPGSMDGIKASWMMRGDQSSPVPPGQERTGGTVQLMDSALDTGSELLLNGDYAGKKLVLATRLQDRSPDTSRKPASSEEAEHKIIDELIVEFQNLENPE